MTPEKQRIAIAEACGWDGIFKNDEGEYCGHQPNQPRFTEWVTNAPLPDYLNDLNAMHEAEKVLTDDQYDDYRRHLGKAANYLWRGIFSATAAQRAEAFLRTLNLWQP